MSATADTLSSTDYPAALREAEAHIQQLTDELARARPAAPMPSFAGIPDENPNSIVRIGANAQQLYTNAAALA